MVVRCVEIKARVADTTAVQGLVHCDSAYIKVHLGDETCNGLVPIDDQLQVLYQSLRTSLDASVYACASESQILYKVFIVVSEEIVIHAEDCMTTHISHVISYFYTERLIVPSEVDPGDARVLHSH